MRYQFFCKKCNKEITLEFSMKDDDGRKNARCPDCKSKVKRIYSSPMISIKGETIIGTKTKNSFVYNGEQVNFGFANHGNMSGVSEKSVSNRVRGVRVDEKSGRLVVDVVSNVKDPLGKLESIKKSVIKKKINQKVKVRK